MGRTPHPDCIDCERHGECVCWSDADQREFDREFSKCITCNNDAIDCKCPTLAHELGEL